MPNIMANAITTVIVIKVGFNIAGFSSSVNSGIMMGFSSG
jgi:hypothetical protein